jgi:alkaline phosphatase
LQKPKRFLSKSNGHNHGGKCSHIEGIHYHTLKAMVEGAGEENNACAVVDVDADNSMTVTGYRKADSKPMAAKKQPASELQSYMRLNQRTATAPTTG